VKWREGDRLHDVVVRPSADGDEREVLVDGQARRVRVVRLGPGRFALEDGARRETFHCARDGASVHLFWRGAAYTLSEEREGRREGPRGETGRLEAPMPGKVTAVKVAPGQAVGKGQELLVVEAMKMENALRAPRDGQVKAVHVVVGDMVSPGVVLVELE
jgi:3-methylcrotonyl-CoA carboxylase alpha subunit